MKAFVWWKKACAAVFGEGSLALQTAVAIAFLLSVLVLLGNVCCLVAYVKKRIARRKRERAEAERRVQFTLPERDNSFVRTRLHTALRVCENPAEGEALAKQKDSLRIDYAKAMISKLLNAPLSPAERLETEETVRSLNALLSREKWTAQELRFVNDCFAALLKLSAKYAV